MSRFRALIALPFAIALATAACAKDPASGIIVALQTDMALPDDVTSVSLDVTDTSTGSRTRANSQVEPRERSPVDLRRH